MATTYQTLMTTAEVVSYAFPPRDYLSSTCIRPLLITIAEERYIRPRFGNELFNEFYGDTYSDFVGQYIKPALAHFVKSAVIEDLTIMVNENGVKMFYSQSQDSNTEETNEQTTTTSTDSNSSVIDSDKSVTENSSQDETVNTDCQDETSSGPLDGLATSLTTYTANTVDEQTVSELTATSSQNTELDQTTTQSSSSQKNENSSIEESSTTSQETFRAADFLEKRVLISQTFNDANTLLSRAVRYVEDNPELFPSYNPKKTIFRRFF